MVDSLPGEQQPFYIQESLASLLARGPPGPKEQPLTTYAFERKDKFHGPLVTARPPEGKE